MRNLIITFLVLLLNVSFCFAEYVPVPKEKSKEYKAEIENIINKRYATEIKKINAIVKESKIYRDTLIKNGYDLEIFYHLLLNSEVGIWSSSELLIADLVKITYKKYLNLQYAPEHLGAYYDMRDNFYNIIKDNNVNLDKITELFTYEDQQNKIIERYIEDVRTTFPPED